jgi:hypothetical protein
MLIINRAKLEKTKPNQFEPVFILKNRTETGWFEPVSVCFFNLILLFIFNKNRTEYKIITHKQNP